MNITLIFAAVLVLAVAIWIVLSVRNRDAAWTELAHDLGGQFIGGGIWHSSRVQARISQCNVVLDTYTQAVGEIIRTFTRLSASPQSTQGFEFEVSREGLFAKLKKAVGIQDIEIGVPDFDREFMIQGNNVSRVRTVFANVTVRQLLQEQRAVHMQLRGGEIRLQVNGTVRDLERLKALFRLFEATLDELER